MTDCLRARSQTADLRLGPTQMGALTALGGLQTGRAAGVYLHGPAGRGKTWLLDAVTDCLGAQARRYHWGELFTRLDAEMGRRLSDPDPLPRAIDATVGDCRVLCFDELCLSDPDDTWMVERLLRRLLARGVRVVATSNQAPDELLPNPAWHSWARGLIALFERQYVVCRVDDGIDYRSLAANAARNGFAAGAVLPTNPEMGAGKPAGLISGGRPLPVTRHGDALWAGFRELLGAPTGRMDYLLLCHAAPTVGLCHVPALAEVGDAILQRFAVFVDIAHDTDTQLLLALDAPSDWSLLPPRTASRLQLLHPSPTMAPDLAATCTTAAQVTG